MIDVIILYFFLKLSENCVSSTTANNWSFSYFQFRNYSV